MVFMKGSWDLAKCRSHLHRFTDVHYNDLNSESTSGQLPQLKKVRVTLLHVAKDVTKKKNCSTDKSKNDGFDRFFLFGFPQTPHTAVVYTKNLAQSTILLRFSHYMRLGDDLWLLMPQVKAFLSSVTPQLMTDEPLVPCLLSTFLQPVMTLPPYDVKVLDYVHFDFITRSLTVTASVQDNVCSGPFCDCQTGVYSCACTMSAPQRHWCVKFEVMCRELVSNSRTVIAFCSDRTSRAFVHRETLNTLLEDDKIDPVDLHFQVTQLVESVNKAQGFRIIGWFKPASQSDMKAVDGFSIHLSYLMPAQTYTSHQAQLIYHPSPSQFEASQSSHSSVDDNGFSLQLGSMQSFNAALDEHTLETLLVIGGVEKNPGPRKRASQQRQNKRCSRCGKWMKDVCGCATEENEQVDIPVTEEVLQPPMKTTRLSASNDSPEHSAPQLSSFGLESSAAVTQEATNELSEDIVERHRVSRPLSGAVEFNPPSQSQLRNICQLIGIVFVHNIYSHLLPSSVVLDKPARMIPISGDGNCLFASLSSWCSGTPSSAQRLRQFICDQMFNMNLDEMHFQLYSRFNVSNVNDYLIAEEMRDRATHAGDLEIFTFCCVFQVQVIVFSTASNSWLVYRHNSEGQNQPTVLLRHHHNHWEPIVEFTGGVAQNRRVESLTARTNGCAPVVKGIQPCEHSGNFSRTYNNIRQTDSRRQIIYDNQGFKFGSSMENYRNEDSERVAFKSAPINTHKAHLNHDTPFGEYIVKKQFKNYDPDEVYAFQEQGFRKDAERCDKCERRSSFSYPLTFTKISTQNVAGRKFGATLKGKMDISVCQLCFQYLTKPKAEWSFSWPAVLYSFFSMAEGLRDIRNGQNFLSLLPYQFEDSWQKKYDSGTCFGEENLFVDITQSLADFNQLIESYEAHCLVKAIKKYPFPSVRCFCGSSEYQEECGLVSFHHVLNYLNQDFVSFGADFRSHIRGIRHDFFNLCDRGLAFQLRPALLVSEDGLFLAVCDRHRKGSNLIMLHVPRNPVLSNLTHPSADRMAPMTSTLREAKPAKRGHFSNTWTLSRPIAGSSGVGSIILHSSRNFAAKSDFLLPVIESIFCHNRQDMESLISKLTEQQFWNKPFVENLWRCRFDADVLNEALKSGTAVCLSTVLKMKEHLETTESVGSKCFRLNSSCIRSTNLKGHAPPRVPEKVWTSLDYFVSFLRLAFLNIPQFSNLLIGGSATPFMQALRDLMHVRKTVSSRRKTLEVLIESFKAAMCTPGDDFCTNLTTFCGFFQEIQCQDAALRLPSSELGKDIVICFDNAPEDSQITVISRQNATYDMVIAEFLPTSNRSLNITMRTTVPSQHWYDVCIFDGSVKQRNVEVTAKMRKRARVRIFVKRLQIPENHILVKSAQSSVLCPFHNLQLCVEIPKTAYKCVHPDGCKLKPKWRCPHNRCRSALCKKHFTRIVDEGCFPLIGEEIDDSDFQNAEPLGLSSTDHISEDEEDSDDENLLSGFYNEFLGPSSSLTDAIFLDTDAGDSVLPIETQFNCQEENSSVPIHGLLNSISSVLMRKKSLIPDNKKILRYFQSFAAQNQKTSLSLLQPEALLFPSIFFHQQEDSSYTGAIPFFLYAAESQCRQLGFQSLLDHLQVRLTDITLPTCGNMEFIQYCADSLVNLSLRHHHTDDFVQRGIQSIEVDGRPVEIYKKEVSFHCSDTFATVNKLATAVRKQMPGLFLTISLNQADHAGVAELIQAINEAFEEASQEVKDAALRSYMGVIIRSWNRSVKLFVNYLLKSKQDILGRITKIWCRAEFQTSRGNPQHYHLLIWLLQSLTEISELIQCSEKSLLEAFNSLFNSDLRLVETQDHLDELFHKCVRLHSHSCEQADYRCFKRLDLDNNKVCRFPPNPPSHSPWILDIGTQYPKDVLELLEEIGLAANIPETCEAKRVIGCLRNQKQMYAATSGEHLLPTSAVLFSMFHSSVNLLKVKEGRMVASYLASYLGKEEDREDAEITSGSDGKSFRLRQEGIRNNALATERHYRKETEKVKRKKENVKCKMLSITESLFWVLGLPYVMTNMKFIKVQNVAPENRYVKYSSGKTDAKKRIFSKCDFRENCVGLPQFKRLSVNQKVMLDDYITSGENLDVMSSFSLRPPELLFVDSVEQYFSWFCNAEKPNLNELTQLFCSSSTTPWIACTGHQVHVKREELDNFVEFMESGEWDEGFVDAVNYCRGVLNDFTSSSQSTEVTFVKDAEPEFSHVVFTVVSPRRKTEFLVSFVLRFGRFTTERDLFSTNDLQDSYVLAKLLPRQQRYDRGNVIQLLKIYVESDLIHLPGGSQSFANKVRAARSAFSSLLRVTDDQLVGAPLVLISEIVERQKESIEDYLKESQHQLLQHLTRLQLTNLPANLDSLEDNTLWHPRFSNCQYQTNESKAEQDEVISQLILAVCEQMKNRCNLREGLTSNNTVVLGAPGTGKSFVCGAALAFALCNGLTCMVTSVAARRASQLGGIHIHRLFCISTKSLPPCSLAAEALVKLSKDLKKKTLLERLQVLIIEEISLLSGQLLSTMDKIFQSLKDSKEPFGGVLVIANGDCCQLPNIDGVAVFQSSTVIFGFQYCFLQHLVRMRDDAGRQLLSMLEKRPIDADDVPEILRLIETNCTFLNNWDDLDHGTTMRVFGKRAAEKASNDNHESAIRSSNTPHFIATAHDEMCSNKSQIWRPADKQITAVLNKDCREPERLVIYDGAVLRASRNMGEVVQGSLCIVSFAECSETCLVVYCANSPSAVTLDVIRQRLFLNWTRRTFTSKPGFVMNHRDCLIRRTQFPFSNYVALTIHKLMGDTFHSLATSISRSEQKYSIWMNSQVYVVLSRVNHLINLIFVGDKAETLNAIRHVLLRRNLQEESIYQFFEAIRERKRNQSSVVEIPATVFMRNHFDIPKAEGGFVFVLVSVADSLQNNFHVAMCEDSLSESLRRENSTEATLKCRSKQPWAMGFFFWGFVNSQARLRCFSIVETTCQEKAEEGFSSVVEACKQRVSEASMGLSFCSPGVVRTKRDDLA